MIYLLKGCDEKLLLGLAAGAVVLAGVWWWQQQGGVHRLRSQQVVIQLSGPGYEPADLTPPEAIVSVWPMAPVQSQGPGWLYEVFTPPSIYHSPITRSFSVTPPAYPGETAPSFALELLAVRQEQYRLQLVGYFGAPGDYLAAFTRPGLPGTLLAREGRRFGDLGLALRSFAVKKVLVEHNEAWPVYDVAAFAVLVDEQAGTEVVLDSRSRRLTGAPLALVRPQAHDGQPLEMHVGDTYLHEHSTYRIERIQLDPPEVVVARTVPGQSQPEKRVLHPVPETEKLVTRPYRGSPAQGLAASGN